MWFGWSTQSLASRPSLSMLDFIAHHYNHFLACTQHVYSLSLFSLFILAWQNPSSKSNSLTTLPIPGQINVAIIMNLLATFILNL